MCWVLNLNVVPSLLFLIARVQALVWDSLWDAVELLHCDELHLFNLVPWSLPGLFLLLGGRIPFSLLVGSCCRSSSEKTRVKQHIDLYYTFTSITPLSFIQSGHDTVHYIAISIYWAYKDTCAIPLKSVWSYRAVGCPPLRGMCGGMFFNRCCAFCSSSWKNSSRSCTREVNEAQTWYRDHFYRINKSISNG